MTDKPDWINHAAELADSLAFTLNELSGSFVYSEKEYEERLQAAQKRLADFDDMVRSLKVRHIFTGKQGRG